MYQLFTAGDPDPEATNSTAVILQPLKDTFKEYLGTSSSARAADKLKESLRSILTVQQASPLSLDNDVTLEPNNVTLAFSDRLRCYKLLLEKIISTSPAGARAALNPLHFLTPERDALAVVAEHDKDAVTLVMSNSSSSTAQLDAARSSKLYCGGTLVTFRDAYESVINLRSVLSLMVGDLERPLVLQKLVEYAVLLDSRDGRLFYLAHRTLPYLALHP